MDKILIFGGTTEGRILAEYCEKHGFFADVCVATEYGAELLPKSKKININIGRLDSCQMSEFISKKNYKCVVDATHPYATEVTANIKRACAENLADYIRLLRKTEEVGDCVTAENMSDIIKILNSHSKIILSTLGSKELEKMTEIKNFRERIWVRVLPTADVKKCCLRLDFAENRIIAEKGPFSESDNIRHIKQSGAEILLTKESGATGGFPEKVSAAKQCGIDLIVLKRPCEKGRTIDEVKAIISGIFGGV
ncbi:MAG: precorrin-6A reductase [Ruminococcus sp.]|nr:precorrin-6A reductase [Ruminococcus sp.]